MQAKEEITPALISQLMRPGVLAEKTEDGGDALEAQYTAVSDAIRALPDLHFDVLRLRFVAGYTHSQIAMRHHGLSADDVKALEDRALELLRGHLPASRKEIAHSPAVMYQKTDRQRGNGKRYPRTAIFAWLDHHPKATLPQITAEYGMAHGTAERIRMQWREDRKGESPSLREARRFTPEIETPVVLTMPEPETVARHVVTPTKAPATQPISAPSQSTWYEEQVRQARTFCEVLEEQERAAQAYLQTIQQHVRSARDRYNLAVCIAEVQHKMQRGQIVNEMGGA